MNASRLALTLAIISLAIGVYARVHWPSPATGHFGWMGLLVPVGLLLGSVGISIGSDRPNIQRALFVSSMIASVVGLVSIFIS